VLHKNNGRVVYEHLVILPVVRAVRGHYFQEKSSCKINKNGASS
jgi:hypothetical protein